MSQSPSNESLKQRIQQLETIVNQLQTELAATQKKSATLQEYEKKYDHLMTYAPTGIYEVDFQKGQIVMANSAICEYTGYTEAELLGKNPIELLSPASRAAFSIRIRDALAGKEVPETVEMEIQAKDGRKYWTSLNTQYRYQAGELKSAFVVAHNITERKQMETALRESERRFRDMAELLPQTLYETDSEGTLTFVNQHAYAQSGYGPEDFSEGINAFELIDPEDQERAFNNFARVLAGENIGLSEYKIKRKDGTVYPALIQSSAIYHNQQPTGLRGFIIDISEKKALEEELRRIHKMEAVGTLAGGIAHEFNNILGIILGNAEISLDDLVTDYPIRGNLNEILVACQRGKEVVKQLLNFSKKIDIHMELIDLKSVIKETFGLLRASIPASIEIREICAEEIHSVVADETQINQLLINLCNNASQAMREEGGILTITLENRVIKDNQSLPAPELKPGPYVRLCVEDTGHGITEEHQQKIFDPYFTTREIGKGTGLGLSVVLGIVNNHQGAITVHSQAGMGTRFEVFLPASDGDVSLQSAQPLSNLDGGGERVLLVDDEPALANIYGAMLIELGYGVVTETDPVMAFARFESAPEEFDLVISDMAMPRMTGEKLVAQMLALRPDIPIILCTGFSEKVGPEKAQEIGVKGYLMKPILKAELSQMIREVLAGGQGEGS